MESKVVKPSRKRYVLSGLIFVAGIILFVITLAIGISSSINRVNTRVVVPGEKTIELGEAGGYNIYFEYRSVIDGRLFESNNINGLICSLKNIETGEIIKLNNATVNSNYSIQGREGKSIFSFVINETGKYELKAWYEAGEGEEAVLAIGKGFGKSLARNIFISIGALFLSFTLSLAIFLNTLLKRMKAKKIILEQEKSLFYKH